MSQDRLSYDTDTSSAVQGDIQSIVGRLESLIGEREKAVNSAMADFQADGVSEEYQAVENRFRNAATETRNIIGLVKQTLNLNDQSASGAGARPAARYRTSASRRNDLGRTFRTPERPGERRTFQTRRRRPRRPRRVAPASGPDGARLVR
ncbi:pore-forming ESAT-6 family protein [Arthrobacter sp. ATA002]|uniref:pore-forming ESAT-6 family protein n=1 Tax=Arthrobacter sp. ATA002 TaxID=2991715 RepID=UPI0022A692BE|nr:pore-forming ESAT-6 family protein [Arthrobacter sp. ATA002]WAP51104.1 pore-forming ESAT-6 family protein [Arthrobacter sp. ATA002]